MGLSEASVTAWYLLDALQTCVVCARATDAVFVQVVIAAHAIGCPDPDVLCCDHSECEIGVRRLPSLFDAGNIRSAIGQSSFFLLVRGTVLCVEYKLRVEDIAF